MIRVVVSEEGGVALPPIDVADERFTIGSSAAARVRLPSAVARPDHIVIDGMSWRSPEGSGALGTGRTFAIGTYRVHVAPAPDGSIATPPQRTESLARELARGLLGADGAPSLTVEKGPLAGAKRPLPPPEAVFVIGRGDDANWIIDDSSLSKAHVQIQRGWDGVRVKDVSKNGTLLDGAQLTEAPLVDGALLEFGKHALRFRDPAERHVGTTAPIPVIRDEPKKSRTVFLIAILVAVLALAGIVVLATR
ncbi:MAG TPA: FHA domain-containing protein [Kofleriaceae bacterium]